VQAPKCAIRYGPLCKHFQFSTGQFLLPACAMLSSIGAQGGSRLPIVCERQ
jgi:hypothetical protein